MAPLPSPGAVLGWATALARELAAAPETLSNARRALEELPRLPQQLDRVAAGLDRTITSLDHVGGQLHDVVGSGLPNLDAVVEDLRSTLADTARLMDEHLANLAGTVAGPMAEQLRNMDEVVSELASTLTALLSAIPGAKRVLGSTGSRVPSRAGGSAAGPPAQAEAATRNSSSTPGQPAS